MAEQRGQAGSICKAGLQLGHQARSIQHANGSATETAMRRSQTTSMNHLSESVKQLSRPKEHHAQGASETQQLDTWMTDRQTL
jgi:hypothetical protein